MNREQMIAWLTLEGYAPYNNKAKTVEFTFSNDGQRGIWCDSKDSGTVAVFKDETIHDWGEVPTIQLKRACAQLFKEKNHEPR